MHISIEKKNYIARVRYIAISVRPCWIQLDYCTTAQTKLLHSMIFCINGWSRNLFFSLKCLIFSSYTVNSRYLELGYLENPSNSNPFPCPCFSVIYYRYLSRTPHYILTISFPLRVRDSGMYFFKS